MTNYITLGNISSAVFLGKARSDAGCRLLPWMPPYQGQRRSLSSAQPLALFICPERWKLNYCFYKSRPHKQNKFFISRHLSLFFPDRFLCQGESKRSYNQEILDLPVHIIFIIRQLSSSGHGTDQEIWHKKATDNEMWYLREISILEVSSGHAVQPGAPQFGGAGIGPGQAVLQIQQHLWVFLMLAHLSCGHKHGTYPLSQTLHFGGKRCRLNTHTCIF